MKSTTFAVVAVSLLQLVAAQPHRARHAHVHERGVKRDGDAVVTVVETDYAEASAAPLVVIYVDQDGKPVSTTTENAAVPQSTEVAPAVAAIAAVGAVKPSSSSAASVEPTAPASTSSAATSTPTTGGSNGFGLVYSPYNADGTCKSQAQVENDFKSISKEYGLIRTYGTDCNQVANVLSVVKARNIKLFAGIFDISNLESQVSTIVKAAGGDWSNFDTISVGNELVNSGSASASAVVAAIGTVRGLLKSAGYTGNIVTVDTLVASRANPSLCDASDYCAVNCHPFFDGGIVAADSGKFLTSQIPTLREKLSNKSQKIVVTETGWPWKGASNRAAVPSLDNQAAAISSIKSAFKSNPESVILFTAFNDMWKKNTNAQFEAEQFWGMGGSNSPSG